MTILDLPREELNEHIEMHPHRLVFATISGAHLYGFASGDSDFDIRGVHVLPLEQVVGLGDSDDTVEKDGIYGGLEIDLVTHDLEKFIRLMLRRNGYVLEQVLSPLVMLTTGVHEQLIRLAPRCVTKYHAHHYLGFAAAQWRLFSGESTVEAAGSRSDAAVADHDAQASSKVGRVKPLLYTFRTLLTGIHLMRSGEIEANLSRLNVDARLTYLDELIAAKQSGGEKDPLDIDRFEGLSWKFLQAEYERLRLELEAARDASRLPGKASAEDELNDLLVQERLATRS